MSAKPGLEEARRAIAARLAALKDAAKAALDDDAASEAARLEFIMEILDARAPPLEIYEAWARDDGSLELRRAVDFARARPAPGEVRLDRIAAASWEEAMAIHHIRRGFEPYRPMSSPRACPTCGRGVVYGEGPCRRCAAER